MSSTVQHLMSPTWYQTKAQNAYVGITNYYRPLFRSGSCKPLWHIMIVTAVVMQTATYLGKERRHILHQRAEKKLAMEEYQARHGSSGHH